MVTSYSGDHLTIKIFDANEIEYLTEINDNTLKVIANFDLSSAPLNGGTEIQNSTIPGDQLVNSTITTTQLQSSPVASGLTNDAYLQGRNNANSADLDLVKINTDNLLEHGINWEELRLGNNKILGGVDKDGVDHNFMKVNSSDQWEFLNSAYAKTIYPKTDSTYDLGASTLRWNNIYTDAITFVGGGDSLAHYEHGVFVPKIKGASNPGTTTYNTQEGYYVRIGNTVFYDFVLGWDTSTLKGQLIWDNFPYQDKWPDTSEPGNLFASIKVVDNSGYFNYFGSDGYLKENKGDAGFLFSTSSTSGTVLGQFWVANLST